MLVRREIIFSGIPKTVQKIIKGADTWGISKLESAENGIKRTVLEHAASDGDRSYFQL